MHVQGEDFLQSLQALLQDEPDAIANAANMAALIFQHIPNLNWAGFYFLQNDVLVVGPFQGLPACTRIKIGHGVCGTAVARGETIIVPDVQAFPGHIACDSASQSEIVIPIFREGRIIGVLDIDSPAPNRFSIDDQHLLQAAVHLYEATLKK